MFKNTIETCCPTKPFTGEPRHKLAHLKTSGSKGKRSGNKGRSAHSKFSKRTAKRQTS